MSDTLVSDVGPTVTADPKPKAPRKPTGRRKGTRVSLEIPIRDLLTTAGEFLSFADPYCGPALVEGAPALAKAINLRCMENARTYEMWDKIVGSGGNVGVFLALVPIIQTVAAHHLLPAITNLRERRARSFPEDVPAEPSVETEPLFESESGFTGVDTDEPDYSPTHANPSEFARE